MCLYIYANGTRLQQVDKFKYLGVTFDCEGRRETTVDERINAYSRNVGVLYPLLKDKYVPQKTKVIIYTTILRPVLTYGCEAWSLSKTTKDSVVAAEMRTLRLIRGVTRLHRLRNEIRADLHVEDILSYIERAQLRWFGHVKRMSPERLPRFGWITNQLGSAVVGAHVRDSQTT